MTSGVGIRRLTAARLANRCRLALGVAALAAGLTAQDAPRPRIGVVLSGGGARGAAHIGVLRVLEELRVPVDYLVGNSMGALVGGIYAYGYSPEEMDELIRSLDWSELLSDAAPRADRSFRRKQEDRQFLAKFRVGFSDFQFKLPKGLVQGHAVGNLLRFLLPAAHDLPTFDTLPVPFRAVATEIATGRQVVLEDGSLPTALSASMAIPGVFAPVDIDGRELVDGLVVNNVPIDVARALGAEVVIAIDIGSPLLEAEQIASLLGVTEQMLSILTQQNVDRQLATLTDADLLIRPELGDISSMSFDRAGEAIDIGERTARALAASLRRFSVSEEEYARFLARQRQRPRPPVTIGEIRIVNDSGLRDSVLQAYVAIEPGDPYAPDVLQESLDRLYGLEEFERVTFELDPRPDGGAALDVIADRKSWGPHYLRFGLNLVDDFDGGAYYELGVNYTMHQLNGLGGELRNQIRVGRRVQLLSEFFQPLEPTQTLFIAPFVSFDRRPIELYDRGEVVTELDVRYWRTGLDAGAILGNWGELRVGLRTGGGSTDVEFTSVGATGGRFENTVLRAQLAVDTLDNVNFPTTGDIGRVEWSASLPGLGADDDYQRLEITAAHVLSFGRTSIAVAGDVGTELDGELPPYQQFFRGGFLRLSGLREYELTGRYAALFRLIGYHRIAGSPTDALGMPLYVGGSLETGNTWNRSEDVFEDMIVGGSVFVGADTLLGPIYFGYGLAEGGRDALYLYLGQSLR